MTTLGKHELWDVYDANKRVTGRTIYRDQWEDGLYHLVVHLCLLDEQGRMLIQQRSMSKTLFPGCWDMTVAGNALSGETSQGAILRESAEELGLELDLTGKRPDLSISFDAGFDDIYVARLGIDEVRIKGTDGAVAAAANGAGEMLTGATDLAVLPLQSEEVVQVRWATREEVMDLLAAGEFLPYSPGFLAYLFEMRPVGGFLIE